MGGSTSTVSVGLQTNLEGPGSDAESKTYICNQAQVGSTLLAPANTRHLPIGPKNSAGGDQAADGWVDAVVATPLFPNGRPPGADRQTRHQKRVSKFRVFSDGVVFEGPEAATMDAHDLSRGYERLSGRVLTRVMVGDKRAQQVLVAYADGRFWAVPSRQVFSRHLGVCLILGDKTVRGSKHKLRVGDIIRVGSVGLLVSELNPGLEGYDKQVVSQDVLAHIREDIHTAPTQVLAPLREQFETGKAAEEGRTPGAADDDDDGKNSPSCYICMDEAESDQDALIAPCQCKGSTALVHVKCLQRLLSTGDAHKTNVVSTRHGSHTCKICKARYKTHVKLKDGTLVPLLNPTLSPPSLTLIVVTRHEPHPDLFNNIFQLSFARTSELSLGRSQACDVVIGYRTVSTRHATLSYSRGEFFYQDNRSSNGSLLYLRAPLELPPNKVVRLRMGRSVLSLRARRNMQLSALSRRTALDAFRWVSTLARRGPSSSSSGGSSQSRGGGEGPLPHIKEERSTSSSGGGGDPLAQVTGAELLRRLFEGELEEQRDRSIDEAIEQMNLLAWSMVDESSSSSEKSSDHPQAPRASGANDHEEEEDDEAEQQLHRQATPVAGRAAAAAGVHGAHAASSSSMDSSRERRARPPAAGAMMVVEGMTGRDAYDAGEEEEEERWEDAKEEEHTVGESNHSERGDDDDEEDDEEDEEDELDVERSGGWSLRRRRAGSGSRRRGSGGSSRWGSSARQTGQEEEEAAAGGREEQQQQQQAGVGEDDVPSEGPRFSGPCSRSEAGAGPTTSSSSAANRPPFLSRTRSSVV